MYFLVVKVEVNNRYNDKTHPNLDRRSPWSLSANRSIISRSRINIHPFTIPLLLRLSWLYCFWVALTKNQRLCAERIYISPRYGVLFKAVDSCERKYPLKGEALGRSVSLANAQKERSCHKKRSSTRQHPRNSQKEWRTIPTTAMVQMATAFSLISQEAMTDSSKMTALTLQPPRHFPSLSFHRVKRNRIVHSHMQQLLLLQLAIS